MEVAVIGLLSAIIIIQQVFFLIQIQRLVDKLMSRTFTEYKRASEPLPKRVKVDNDIPEDLRTLPMGITI